MDRILHTILFVNLLLIVSVVSSFCYLTVLFSSLCKRVHVIVILTLIFFHERGPPNPLNWYLNAFPICLPVRGVIFTLLICAWSLSNLKFSLDKHNCPPEICIWFWGVNISTKHFYFSQIGIYILKIHLSIQNLGCKIPKRISHTSVQNPTYEFHKRKISYIEENISSIQNYQGLSFLPVTCTGLADLNPQLGSWHAQLFGDIMYLAWWSSDKILAWDAGGLSLNPGCDV